MITFDTNPLIQNRLVDNERESDTTLRQNNIEIIKIMIESGRSIDACWDVMEKSGYSSKYIGTVIMEAKRQFTQSVVKS